MTQRLELPIEGMTCAACAVRVEKKLNRLSGVEARVNYATERASVDYDAEAVSPDQLVAAVESAGYRATVPSEGTVARDDGAVALRRRLLFSAAMTLPARLPGMVSP